MCSLKGQLTLEPFFAAMDFLGLCLVSQWKANNCIFIFSKADSSAHTRAARAFHLFHAFLLLVKFNQRRHRLISHFLFV